MGYCSTKSSAFERETGLKWPSPFWNLVSCFTKHYDRNDPNYMGRLNVKQNIDNDRYDNTKYLHEYFPRSAVENCYFFRQAFSARWVRSLFENKPSINILIYGCGTGGDLLGLLCAFLYSDLTGKTLHVYALDGNRDALRKCEVLVAFLQEFRDLGNKIDLTIIHHNIIVGAMEGESDFGTDLFPDVKFDVILTSKLLNELVANNSFVYRYFLSSVVLRFLQDGGLALISDVPEKREMFDWEHESSRNVWIAKALGKAVSNFCNQNRQFHILLPFPCDLCRNLSCDYSAVTFRLPMRNQEKRQYQTTICARLLIKSELPGKGRAIDRLWENHGFITTYRLDDRQVSCIRPGALRQPKDLLNGYMMIEAWK